MTNYLKALTIASLLCCVCACEQPEIVQKITIKTTRTSSKSSHHSAHLWERMRKNFHIVHTQPKALTQQQVQKYVKKYQKNEKFFTMVSNQAAPYLYYIVEQLEKRNMPTELALLPMLESDFQPLATSSRGAAGIWQFMPSTGRMHGLKQDAWYDGRRDIKASTKAALDHLQILYKQFNKNWILALAAYNAGEGAVQRAIANNKRAGKPISFWDLKLPRQTKEYIPKFLALAEVIKNPEKHDVTLPSIKNLPYFKPVNPGKHLHLGHAAKLAGLDVKELKKLNPGYRKTQTHPKGPQELLLPIANVATFEYNLAKKPVLYP